MQPEHRPRAQEPRSHRDRGYREGDHRRRPADAECGQAEPAERERAAEWDLRRRGQDHRIAGRLHTARATQHRGKRIGGPVRGSAEEQDRGEGLTAVEGAAVEPSAP